MNHETCCLLALIPQRAHPEIVPLILMTYWRRTARPPRSRFSQWGVCGVRENSDRKKHTDTFTWNHQSSTLEHGTSAVGPRCQDSYGACSLCKPVCTRQICRNTRGVWRVKYEERVNVFTCQMTTQTHTF